MSRASSFNGRAMVSETMAVIGGMAWAWYKTVLRFITGLCELQRICAPSAHTPATSSGFERSLRYSRKLASMWGKRHEASAIEDFENHILEIKGKVGWNRAHLRRCVTDVVAVSRAVPVTEERRKMVYDSENPAHELMLLALWANLRPDEALTTRRSKQWQTIGFQGLDPATDFRGMGLLGLDQLCYFASKEKRVAHSVLAASLDRKYGYSFCIVGINITGYIVKLLKSGLLNTFLYAQFAGLTSKDEDLVRALNVAYVQLFEAFGRFWLASKPKNMMAFIQVFTQFSERVEAQLKDTARWATTKDFDI